MFIIKFSLPVTFHHPIYHGTTQNAKDEFFGLVLQFSSSKHITLQGYQSGTHQLIDGNGDWQFRRTITGERDQKLRLSSSNLTRCNLASNIQICRPQSPFLSS